MSASDTPDDIPGCTTLPSSDILRHIVDVHCHPTDAPDGVSDMSMDRLKITVCAMSTMPSDQDKVRNLASRYPQKVVPCFGYHPWFSHLIQTGAPPISKEAHYRGLFFSESSFKNDPSNSEAFELQFNQLLDCLPAPRPLDVVIDEVRRNLLAFPNAMVGEIGVDRVFRVPVDFFASPRVLTAFHIPLSHQLAVMQAQLELAIELGRNVSIHSVKAQQATIDLLGEMKLKHGAHWNKISVDMHSCGFSAQSWRDIEKKHENVFLSLSTVINHKHLNHRDLIAACSPDRLLAESDYNDIDECTTQTWEIINIIANVRGWKIETDDAWALSDSSSIEDEDWGVIRRLERNWIRFKNGQHQSKQTMKQNKKKN